MQDPRQLDIPMPRIEECAVQSSVRIERVVGSISAPVFLPAEGEADGDIDELDGPVAERMGVLWPESAGRSLAIALLVGLVAGYVLNDARAGLALAVATWILLEIRIGIDMIPFSFGEGFLGYRSDQGWPQGVQEDDDVHWSWKGPAPSGHPRAAISGR